MLRIIHGRPRSRWPALAAAGILLVGAAACDDEPAPPFLVEGTGGIEGLLFYDDDRNGAFDPSAGDSAVPGVTVVVRERGTTATFSGGQAQSDAGGRFTIDGLPLGTHDLFLDTLTVAPGVAFCQNPVQVSVTRDVRTFAPVAGRRGCVIPIEEAEALGVGAFVTVRGVVTAAPGQLRREASYIQDATGAVQIFDADLFGLGIEVGDRIEVSGPLGQFGQELEVLNDVRVNEIVKAFAIPVPDTLTTTEVFAAGAPPTNPVQGTFVTVRGAQQMSAFSLGGGRNANFDDGSGAVEIRIEVGLIATAADVATQFPPGKCYNITGVIGSFNGVAQLKPRTLADMQEVSCN